MSNYFQIIVARRIGPGGAAALAQQGLDWLADEAVIVEEPSHSVPDEHSRGFHPGPAWRSAVVELDESFLEMELNGVQPLTGRQIFDAGQYDPVPYCPKCHEPAQADQAWEDALADWEAGDDAAPLHCPHCEEPSLIVDWRHSPPIGFGRLGFCFWNWPSLNREFIERLAAELGQPMMLVEGKR